MQLPHFFWQVAWQPHCKDAATTNMAPVSSQMARPFSKDSWHRPRDSIAKHILTILVHVLCVFDFLVEGLLEMQRGSKYNWNGASEIMYDLRSRLTPELLEFLFGPATAQLLRLPFMGAFY